MERDRLTADLWEKVTKWSPRDLMETFESSEVELDGVSRTAIAGRMPHIAGEQFQLSCKHPAR